MVNYNAGSGCLGLAVNQTWTAEHQAHLGCDVVHFTKVCAPAQKYVNDISK